MSRSSVDKWGKREQLCLASAVSCSGEQNWSAVSRAMKTLCKQELRPVDWYSQNNCALQYAHLLDSVEVTKRKKRDGGDTSSPIIVEPPLDLLIKRLTEEHMQDIKEQMDRDREEYAQLFRDIKVLESEELSREELLEMWRQMDKEDETKRIEEMKLENRMREREQRKQEIISNWRSSSVKRRNSNTDTTSVDMDVEEIVTDSKPTTLPIQQQQQQQQQQQPPTSPLLSSLLKLNASGVTTTSSSNASAASTTTNSIARTSAPTITTLLTSGNIPKNPAITIKSNVPASEIAFYTRPISGPPVQSDTIVTPTITNTLKSPSQSAPTLSMLLEKNKSVGAATINSQNASQQLTEVQQQKISEPDANNTSEVPASNDNDKKPSSEAAATTKKLGASPSGTPEADDNDPNEEQQLLEAFENIGNIDDIEIDMAGVIDDEEVDFLEDVDASSTSEVKEVIDFEDKLDELKRNQESLVAASEKVGSGTKSAEIKKNDTNPSGEKSDVKTEIIVGSSDESNDNIPLAEVATSESKERSQSLAESTKEQEEAAESANDESLEKKEGDLIDNQTKLTEDLTKTSNENDDKESTSTIHLTLTTDKEQSSEETDLLQDTEEDITSKPKLPTESDSSDVILIQTDDDESVFEKPTTSSIKSEIVVERESSTKVVDTKQSDDGHEEETKSKSKIEIEKVVEASDNCVNIDIKPLEAEKIEEEDIPTDGITNVEESSQQTTIITIPDTDEDSSMTDVSKEEAGSSKSTTNIQKSNNKTIGMEDMKPEIDNAITTSTTTPTTTTTTVTNTSGVAISAAAMAPARPPILRKLAERSESPMIEDETTTTSDQSTKPNSRRRYSSTPVIDSIPNSPASSEYMENDRRETRGASKKIFLNIYNNLHDSKNAVIFRRPFQDEHSKNADLCLKPMDLPTIKRNIDSGIIRNVVDLQRDMLLMSQNIQMIYRPHTAQYKSAVAFLQDCQAIKEFSSAYHEPKSLHSLPNTNSLKSRSGSRKSQRHI